MVDDIKKQISFNKESLTFNEVMAANSDRKPKFESTRFSMPIEKDKLYALNPSNISHSYDLASMDDVPLN